MELLADGLGFPESLRWHDGRVWLCNWGSGEVLAFGPDGSRELMAQLPADTLPLSVDWTPAGELLVVDGPRRRVLRDGEVIEEIPGEGPLNEITVGPDGAIFVNGGDGVFRLGDGEVVLDGLLWPNGMAVMGSELIVADSHRRQLIAVDLESGDRRIWAEVEFAPDGICADPTGAIWYATVPGRACIRVADGGEVLGTVAIERGGFSCTLGDGTLYIGAAEFAGMEALREHGPGTTGQLVAAPVDG